MRRFAKKRYINDKVCSIISVGANVRPMCQICGALKKICF